MDTPILEFFNEEGLINKDSYLANSPDFKKMNLIKEYHIDTALFVFHQNIEEVVALDKLEEFYDFTNASNINKCYIYDKKFVLAISPLGGPAAGGLMEELGFMGIKNFFACGSAGQIDQAKNPAEFVLVKQAIRCEGTSYHYLPPSLSVATDQDLTNFVATYLQQNNYQFNQAATWTTDAFYRETASEVNSRKKQGAVCVEMECASWAAIAKFRGYKFTELLYFSDAVKQEGWQWHPTKEELKNAIIKLMIGCVEEFVSKRKRNG